MIEPQAQAPSGSRRGEAGRVVALVVALAAWAGAFVLSGAPAHPRTDAGYVTTIWPLMGLAGGLIALEFALVTAVVRQWLAAGRRRAALVLFLVAALSFLLCIAKLFLSI